MPNKRYCLVLLYNAFWRRRLQQAYGRPTYPEARAASLRLRQELRTINRSAAANLEEGLEEALTLHRLGVLGVLGVRLKTTNCLESLLSQVGQLTDRVDRWRTSDQKHRWVTSALLEIGTGYLALATVLRRRFPTAEFMGVEYPSRRYVWTDTYRERLERERIRLVTTDLIGCGLPFRARSFALVTFAEVIEHLPPQTVPGGLAEIRRVLVPGGALLVTTPNLASWYNRELLLREDSPGQQSPALVIDGSYGHLPALHDGRIGHTPPRGRISGDPSRLLRPAPAGPVCAPPDDPGDAGTGQGLPAGHPGYVRDPCCLEGPVTRRDHGA